MTNYFTAGKIELITIVLIASTLAWLHQDYPIVRNSLFYAEIAQSISEHGIFSSEVEKTAFNKPMGFSILAWPIVNVFGANIGLKIASTLATALWALMVLLLLQRFMPKQAKSLRLAIIIALFNPLVFYQFISAYPDSLFAAFFLAALLSMDRTFSLDARWWDSFILSFMVFLAAWVKHHGFVLLLIIPVFMLFRWSIIKTLWQQYHAYFLARLLPLVILLITFYLAQKGLVPTFNLGHNQSNYLGGSARFDIIYRNMGCLSVYLWISYSCLLILPFYFSIWLKPKTEWLAVALIFIITVLFYRGAGYNTRYFLALAPFIAWALTSLLIQLPKSMRYFILLLFILINSLTIINYNVPEAREKIENYISLPKIDNLRLGHEQENYHKQLKLIHQYAAKNNNTLVFLSNYYHGRVAKAWENAGLLPKGMKIFYARKWKPHYLKRWGLTKALFFDYPSVGAKPSKRILKDPRLKSQLTQLTPYLYQFDIETDHKR